jgi:ATP-dependent DNA helicase PIF1
MLAWAVTIHKSQGKTFDRVIIDFGTGAFAHGQAYVALSRCTTFTGMVLRRPVSSRDIMTDDRIKRFALEIAPPIDSAQPERISNRVDGGDRKERALRAIEGREGVRISYEDKDGNIRSRNVWPSKVALYANEPGKEILIAFDYDEQQEIVFDFERILAIE